MLPDLLTPSGAVFINYDGTPSNQESAPYRPLLWRYWGPGKSLLHVCGLNPSTAGHVVNDPTIRREIDFAKRWGFDGLIKTNAFDLRATDPKVMLAHARPNSTQNDFYIYLAQLKSGPPYGVAAWGVHGAHLDRYKDLKACGLWKCLGTTRAGHPRHPLYVKATTQLVDLT